MKNTSLQSNKFISLSLVSIVFSFFVMGAVDLVGITSNYLKKDFGLTDTLANLFPSMVFLWFFIFSVPTGLLMNRIGRRKTVLLSLVITAIGLIIPVISYSLPTMFVAFSLLGIGNTVMQVSLNPLISNVVAADKLASTLTFGQFVKAIASFSAPLIAGWATLHFGNWLLLFPIYAGVSILSFILLSVTPIQETPYLNQSSFADSFKLLNDKQIFLFFLGVMSHVGIDVGINATAPKILMEKTGLLLTEAGFATSIYFLFRVIGSFSGTFIMKKYSLRKFYLVGIACMVLASVGLFFSHTVFLIYVCIALIGYGNSNIFPIIFSHALQYLPERANEISGLMIMGIAGGAVFPLLMGVSSDLSQSQLGAVVIVLVLVLYLSMLKNRIKHS